MYDGFGLCVIYVSVSSIYSICMLFVHRVVQFVYYMSMKYVCHYMRWCVCVCCLVAYACVVCAAESGIVWWYAHI